MLAAAACDEEDQCLAVDPLKLRTSLVPLLNRKSSPLTRFYSDQNDQIENFLRPVSYRMDGEEKRQHLLKIAVYGSLLANIFLLGIQLYAAVTTTSLSIFATLADAFMDLLSNIVLIITGKLSKSSPSFDKYPTGKGKMETAGIIVFACLMATLALQIIIEAVRSLITNAYDVKFDIISFAAVGVAICITHAPLIIPPLGTKFCLYLFCISLKQYPSAAILAMDHRNDVILNVFGLALSIAASKSYRWLDPAGGILIALLICRSWSATCRENIQLIVGKSAPPQFLQKITYIAMTHDPRVQQIDTCRAYHSGSGFYVEVDIVLPPTMELCEAHDIGETLQMKLEVIEQVERAFVHLDYETDHKPEHRKEQ